MAKEHFIKSKTTFFPYFEQIVPLLECTHKIYLVTANAQFVAEAVVEMFGLDGHISTEMEVLEGKFTEKVTKSLAEEKRVVTERITPQSYKQSMAFGDSEGDIEMLDKVEHAICINPDAKLLGKANQIGWAIVTPENIMERVRYLLEVK